jgi:hypothetical protein
LPSVRRRCTSAAAAPVRSGSMPALPL